MQRLQKNYRSRLYVLPEGVNSLLSAGDPLLTLVTTLDEREIPQDRAQFRDDIVFELNIFDRQLKLGRCEEKLVRLSQQVMIFFIEQRMRRMVGWEDFVLSERSNLNLDWFKEIIAKILAKQIDHLIFIEFVYTWLKTNPWIWDERGDSSVQARDMVLLLAGKLYSIIQSRRPKNSVKLLVGDWNTTGGTTVRVGERNLGSPYWWLFGAVTLLFVFQLLLSSKIWRYRAEVAHGIAQISPINTRVVSDQPNEKIVQKIESVKTAGSNAEVVR